MAVRRQLETALAEVEHAGKRGFFEPARRYLQLVSNEVAFEHLCLHLSRR